MSFETLCFPLPWCSLHKLLFLQLQKNFYFHSYNCFGLPQEEKVFKKNLWVSKMYLETQKRGIVKVCGTFFYRKYVCNGTDALNRTSSITATSEWNTGETGDK